MSRGRPLAADQLFSVDGFYTEERMEFVFQFSGDCEIQVAAELVIEVRPGSLRIGEIKPKSVKIAVGSDTCLGWRDIGETESIVWKNLIHSGVRKCRWTYQIFSQFREQHVAAA